MGKWSGNGPRCQVSEILWFTQINGYCYYQQVSKTIGSSVASVLDLSRCGASATEKRTPTPTVCLFVFFATASSVVSKGIDVTSRIPCLFHWNIYVIVVIVGILNLLDSFEHTGTLELRCVGNEVAAWSQASVWWSSCRAGVFRSRTFASKAHSCWLYTWKSLRLGFAL